MYNLFMIEETKSEIIIYKDQAGPQLEVRFEGETAWLTQAQIAQLFGTKRPAITKHLTNIFKDGELSEKSVSSILEHTAADGKTYKVKFYNLDAVISVGYRVNSKRATQFRIWATQRLRDYILKGYAIDEKRLKEAENLKLGELTETLRLIQKAVATTRLAGYEKELFNIISDYADTWVALYQYDKGDIKLDVSKKKPRVLDYEKVARAIESLKSRLTKAGEATDIFGVQRSKELKGILGSIEQTFGGKELYKSIEEKAAHLLYFMIKDHPFVDGNKRIGSLLFILYLVENNFLYGKNGEKKINDNALTALALLVAESSPKQKDVMVKLTANLLSK